VRLEGDSTTEEIDEFFLDAPGEWTGTLEDWMAQFDSETDGLIAEKERLAEQVGVFGTDLKKARRRLEDLARSSERVYRAVGTLEVVISGRAAFWLLIL
jgi:hypothetical protein